MNALINHKLMKGHEQINTITFRRLVPFIERQRKMENKRIVTQSSRSRWVETCGTNAFEIYTNTRLLRRKKGLLFSRLLIPLIHFYHDEQQRRRRRKKQMKRINSRSKREQCFRLIVVLRLPFSHSHARVSAASCPNDFAICSLLLYAIHLLASFRPFVRSSILPIILSFAEKKMLSIRICFVDWREFGSTEEWKWKRKSRLLLRLSKRALLFRFFFACRYMLFNWGEY